LRIGGTSRIGDEVLPDLPTPVEQHPDAVRLIGIAEDMRTLGAMLPSLLGARGREDLYEPVEVLDPRRRWRADAGAAAGSNCGIEERDGVPRAFSAPGHDVRERYVAAHSRIARASRNG
jgi:hypothetical protein